MTPADIDRVFGRGRLRMVTGEHVEVFREEALAGERRRYTKRFLATAAGDFREWTEREWRILARLVGHGVKPVPDVVRFDRGAADRPALVQTYDAGVTVDHWATLLPLARDGRVLRNVFEDCAHWWALARHCLLALDAIHALQLVHLDLKADNVCIPVGPDDFDPLVAGQSLQPRFEQIALIDFAFSLVSGESLDSALPIAQQAGYEYQSPRLLRALELGRHGDVGPTRQLDWRCDLYSLSAMLWRYLPELETPSARSWTRQRHAQARALVRRLVEVHDAELPAVRPHAELIAFASEPLQDSALAGSLQRGWTLAIDSAAASADWPTPVTRVALPVDPPAVEQAAIMIDPADLPPRHLALERRRRERTRNIAWIAGIAAVAALSVPLLGQAWLALQGGGADAGAQVADAAAAMRRVETPLAAELQPPATPQAQSQAPSQTQLASQTQASSPSPSPTQAQAPTQVRSPPQAQTQSPTQVQSAPPQPQLADAIEAVPAPGVPGTTIRPTEIVAADNSTPGPASAGMPAATAPAPTARVLPPQLAAASRQSAPQLRPPASPGKGGAASVSRLVAKGRPAQRSRVAQAQARSRTGTVAPPPRIAASALANSKTAAARSPAAVLTALPSRPAAAAAVLPTRAALAAPAPARPVVATGPVPGDVAAAQTGVGRAQATAPLRQSAAAPTQTAAPTKTAAPTQTAAMPTQTAAAPAAPPPVALTSPPATAQAPPPAALTSSPAAVPRVAESLRAPTPFPGAATASAEPRAQPSSDVAGQQPLDFVARSNDLMNNHMRRLAQRGERIVGRVLAVAGRADGVAQDADVREAASAMRRAPPDPFAEAMVATRDAKRLNDAAHAEYLRHGGTPEALNLQLRAFGANPSDPDIVGNLAFLYLRQRPAQPEWARRLALHALTLDDPGSPYGRIEDWATLAIASALSGRERESRDALLVTLALAPNLERQCRAAMDAYSTYGERLRPAVEAMLYRVHASGRSERSPFCEWPPHWVVSGAAR